MKFSRIMSVYKNDLIEILNKKEITIRKNSSWSGENATESFKNELEKDIEVCLFYETDNFVKMESDEDEFDIDENDVSIYDEYRNTSELTLKIQESEWIEDSKEWINDQIDDIGYVELNLKNK